MCEVTTSIRNRLFGKPANQTGYIYYYGGKSIIKLSTMGIYLALALALLISHLFLVSSSIKSI